MPSFWHIGGRCRYTSGSCSSERRMLEPIFIPYWSCSNPNERNAFTKAGKPGWAAIVPFYNLYILFEITWGNGLLFLLMLIPIVNSIVAIITMVKLAKAFGKGGGFAVGLIFLSLIFILILFHPILSFSLNN